jgi:threonine/homoserine/homoserine lactone efflux protein
MTLWTALASFALVAGLLTMTPGLPPALMGVLDTPSARRVIDAITGAVLVGFEVKLALDAH